jgi:O-antigen ligase
MSDNLSDYLDYLLTTRPGMTRLLEARPAFKWMFFRATLQYAGFVFGSVLVALVWTVTYFSLPSTTGALARHLASSGLALVTASLPFFGFRTILRQMESHRRKQLLRKRGSSFGLKMPPQGEGPVDEKMGQNKGA